MQRSALTLLLLLAWCAAAAAQPVLDAEQVPKLNPAGKASYREFLLMNLPRAFALGSSGAFGWIGGSGTIETARARAMESCTAKGATDCAIYAENLDILWPGLATHTPPPPAALVSNWNYEAVPDARYFWHGPATAAGVYVWAHGLGALNGQGALADSRGLQPQAHVRAFNNIGYDVIRFDRHPNADLDRNRTAAWLETLLTDLRQRGYRHIVVGGQSRGGWNALQMLGTRNLADTVIAISPAAHGTGGSTNLSAQYDDLRQIVTDVPPSSTRLAFVQFTADPFAGDLPARAALAETLRPKLGGLLILDRPDGFSGHYGGTTALFARRFADCLLRFATEPTPRRVCQ